MTLHTPTRPQPFAARGADALTWLPAAWLAFFFVSNIKLTSRDAAAALAGSASVDNLIELGVYGLVGMGCLAALARWRRRTLRSAGLTLLGAYAALIVASVVWSSVPLFSLIRGSQVLVVALLAVVSAEAWRRGLRDLTADWVQIWFGFALIVAGLTLFGLVVGTTASRFAWPGTHPIFVGAYLGIGAIVAMSMLLERGWNLRRSQYRLVLALLAWFLLFIFINATRSTLAAFVVAAVVVYLTRSARRLDLRWLVVPFAALGGVLVAMAYSDGLAGYVLRGQSIEEFATLSDRTELWGLAWDLATESIIAGRGYGAGRGLFLELFPWAGTAHSLWAELAVDLGLLGLGLAAGLLIWALWQAAALQAASPGPVGNVAIGVLVLSTVAAFAETGFVFPGVFLTILGLVVAALAAAREGSYATLFAARAARSGAGRR